ncbi:MAG: beta-galactosidase [Bacteroidota bacterium]|nr:beta-galactosidase [Bacteroidota bacterium]
MKKIVLSGIIALLFFSMAQAQQKHRFGFSNDQFLLDGKPYRIISGEIHPARVPAEYWRQRIKMAKAMGCNTIAAYIFWNYHETEPGRFDFQTGNKNISRFLQICKEENMWVIMRPGPYVCAEWDFGGIPPYLLKIPDIKLRCMDPRYMQAVTRYFQHFSRVIKPFMLVNGGTILMVQVENEYGSYGNDREYMKTLRSLWIRNGINGPFYTSDGATAYMLEAGTLDSAAIGLDSGVSPDDFEAAAKQNPHVPAFSGETYPGWLTNWGEEWQRPDNNNLKREIKFLLENNKSFNLYVIHGGTNFGFTAGANAFSPTQYQPDVTSYDYDAPINEQGRATPKYYMLRNLIQQYVSHPLPEIPAPVKTIEIPPIEMKRTLSLWNYVKPSLHSAQPKPMEDFGQNQGVIVYSTRLIGHKSGVLKIWEPHDYALVFLNGEFIDTVYRDGGKWEVKLPKTSEKNPFLEIVVEGMGHINFAQFMIDRKGITDRVTLNGMTLMNWNMALLPLDEHFIKTAKPDLSIHSKPDKPCNFFEAEFNLTETGDTYFDVSQFSKGILYVNGHNLGRYWNKGPQERLYCPASWLKKGTNQILLFDFRQLENAVISGKQSLY